MNTNATVTGQPTQWDMTYPAIYHPTNWDRICTRPEDMVMGTWGWMQLREVYWSLAHLHHRAGLPEIPPDPYEIFRRYGLLCNRHEDTALFTWATFMEYERDVASFPPNRWHIYIPAGWGKRILRIAGSGIIKLSVVPHVTHEISRPPTLACFGFVMETHPPIHGPFVKHQLIGHKLQREQTVVLLNGEGGSTTENARSISMLG